MYFFPKKGTFNEASDPTLYLSKIGPDIIMTCFNKKLFEEALI